MENTIENALEWYTEKWMRSIVLPSINNTQNMSILIHEYAKLIAAPKDQRISELEANIVYLYERIERNEKETAALQREIASLRSRLQECERKRITGARI